MANIDKRHGRQPRTSSNGEGQFQNYGQQNLIEDTITEELLGYESSSTRDMGMIPVQGAQINTNVDNSTNNISDTKSATKLKIMRKTGVLETMENNYSEARSMPGSSKMYDIAMNTREQHQIRKIKAFD